MRMYPNSKNKIICILCAGVKSKDGKWMSTGWDDEDFDYGIPGGTLREWATYYLSNDFPEAIIFVPGQRGHDVVNDEPARPDLSDIIKYELVELGVQTNRIITEHKSNNTHEQLMALVSFGQTGFSEILIITSRCHVGRVKAMIEYKPDLESLRKSNVKIIAAEDILLSKEPSRWKSIIGNLYNNPKMRGIEKNERNGINALRARQYAN